jgi:hypothetical protein
LPAGLDFTAHVAPVGVGDGDVEGDVDGDEDGDVDGEADGDVDGDVGVELGVPPVQAPRSRHSEAAATGFQPAPGGGVCATMASYKRPW